MSSLISGKEALIALANGEDVQYWCENDPSIQKRWTTIRSFSEYKLSCFLEDKPRFEFRLKPRTIKIEIEVPEPFVPKEGEDCFVISPWQDDGWDYAKGSSDHVGQFGFFRTKDEIKQVVEALRQAFNK